MVDRNMPKVFIHLLSNMCIDASKIIKTNDGFFVVYKSLSNILAEKGVFSFPDSGGEMLDCKRFFDDWFLYAAPNEADYTYSLLKLREQEHDAEDALPADGDTPGVTISFVAFNCQVLLDCLTDSSDENKRRLNTEVNRVVVYKGQRHHKALKKYFKNPQSQGAYLVADIYTKYIASFAENGCLPVPERYKEIVQQSISYKNTAKLARLPSFIESLNQSAGYAVCNHEQIQIGNMQELTAHESAAILATHTGNTSVYSFAAEVEYHARYLTPLSRIKIPFFGRSIYDSAIRADMTVDDTEFEGPAPFYNSNSKIVKRQFALHRSESWLPGL